MPSRKTAGVILYYMHKNQPHVVTFRRKEGTEGAGTWVIGPGGHSEKGEKPKKTATRETGQETPKKFRKEQLKKALTWYYGGRKHSTFLGEISRKEAEESERNARDPRHKEFDDAETHPLDELIEKVEQHLNYEENRGKQPEKLFFVPKETKKILETLRDVLRKEKR